MMTGCARRHRLEHGQAEALAERRVAEQRAAAVELGERLVGDVAELERALAERFERAACLARLPPQRPHDHQRVLRLQLLREAPVGLDEPRQVLARLERAHREHEARLRQRRELRRRELLGAAPSERATPSGATVVRLRARGKRAASASAVACEIATIPAARRTARPSVARSITVERRLGRIAGSNVVMS